MNGQFDVVRHGTAFKMSNANERAKNRGDNREDRE